MDELDQIRMAGMGRALLGAFLFVAPRRMARIWAGDETPSPSARVFARGLAGRDLAIGIGVMATAEDEEGRGQWLEAAAMSDAADALASMSGFRQGRGARGLFWAVFCASSAYLHLRLAGELD